MEKDNEVKGVGNSYTTLFRQYDPRLGRWLSLDPKIKEYPYQSPYLSFNNNPIFWTDPFGDDPPKRFSLWKRFKNWIKGDQHKNTANRYAVKEKKEVYSTFDGEIQIIADRKTGEARYFASKRLYANSTLRELGVNNVIELDVQFLNEKELLWEILKDNIFSDNTIQIGQTVFYDDVIGTDENDKMYAKISVTRSLLIEAGFKPKIRFGRKSGNLNAVYLRYKKTKFGVLPYIGKSYNVLRRYSASVRELSNLQPIISGIYDKNLLRAVEQKMIMYLRGKTPIANIRNAMSPKKFSKYEKKVDEILNGTDWKKFIDDFFNL